MARGTLRIYLGAAPGVGKTFAMLNEGRRRAEHGDDVVVGFVETHGRPKTAEQVGDLEVVPRARSRTAVRSSRRWTSTRSSPAAREVALVDELAHTNVPGSRNEKRWQDVEELLDAGHRRDLDAQRPAPRVAQRRRRTDHRGRPSARRSPTRSCARADADPARRHDARGAPPTAWPAATSTRQSASTPRSRTTSAPGNLAALRELALLWLADRVDEALAEYRARHGIDEPWETRERSSSLSPARRTASGSSAARRESRSVRRASSWPSTSSRRTGSPHPRPRSSSASACSSTSSAARTTRSSGAEVAEALIDAARSLNATQIVMGASRRSSWQRLTRGSVIGRVIRESGVGIDVHVISHPEGRSEDAYVVPRTRRPAASTPQARARSASASPRSACRS